MNITVLGAGSWGTALAIALAESGHAITLWGHRREHVQHLAMARENTSYLPGIPLAESIILSDQLEVAVADANVVLCMTPTTSLPNMFQSLSGILNPDQTLFWGSKGFERGYSTLIHEIAERSGLAAAQTGVLSGPSFAKEVAERQPTALVAASHNMVIAEELAENISSDVIRCYSSNDVVGVEIGGALKNVIAIAAGIADGLGFGANTRAALISRGLAEISRVGEALGAKPATLMGLAGMGDLLLTATDNQSRNRRFGLAVGQGQSIVEAEASIGQVVEGRYAAFGGLARAKELGVDMPICEMLVAVIESRVQPLEAIQQLMQRPIKSELT